MGNPFFSCSVMPFNSLNIDCVLSKLGLLATRISLAIEFLGGVLLVKDKLCLLTSTSLLGWSVVLLSRTLVSARKVAESVRTLPGSLLG